MGACCGRPSGAASGQPQAGRMVQAAAGLLLSAADWALLQSRGIMSAAAVLAMGDEGLGCVLQLRSDPSCFSTGVANVRFARRVVY